MCWMCRIRLQKNYDYFIALRDIKGMLKDVKYNESQGKFGNVSGNEYTITAYTWTKQMEPIGMDMKKSYAELNISADKCVDIDEGPIGLFFEDLNYNCDGGLYAEQIENRSFKLQIVTGDGNIVDAVTREPGYAWTSGNGTVNYLTDLPLNDKNTYYAQLSGITSGASLINKAYEGVYVEQGKD